MTYGYDQSRYLVSLIKRIRNSLESQDRITFMKNEALEAISEGRLKGDKSLEYEGHLILAEIGIETEEWSAAYLHIKVLELLRMEISGGWIPYNSPDDRFYRWARFGCVALRCGNLWHAMGLFQMAMDDRLGRHFESRQFFVKSPWTLIYFVKKKTRRCLSMLVSAPKKVMSLKDYYEVDDIMQTLLLEDVTKKAPEFSLEENRVQDILTRRYLISEETRAIGVAEESSVSLGDAFLSFTGFEEPKKEKDGHHLESSLDSLARDEEDDKITQTGERVLEGLDYFHVDLTRLDAEFPGLVEAEKVLNIFLALVPMVDPVHGRGNTKVIIELMGGNFQEMEEEWLKSHPEHEKDDTVSMGASDDQYKPSVLTLSR